ncbi:MAG: G1 family glutamic endopeptidase [Acidimicrobiales bacterium]
MRRFTITAVCLVVGLPALIAAIAGFATAAQAQTPAVNARPSRPVALGGVLLRKNGSVALPRHGGTTTSLNWSGYAVTGKNITAAASTFTVPAAGLVPPGFAATWTGIGGYSSTDLIQAGTAEQSLPTLPFIGAQYYAWYELLPGSENQLTRCNPDPNCTVNPGNVVTVNISQVGGSSAPNNWLIKMTNLGHWKWSKIVSYVSTNSSAEWILEAPTVTVLQSLLAPVGTVGFGPVSTYSTGGGNPIDLAQGSPTQIVLSPGGVNEATPSAIASNGQSFNVCAYAMSCPTP